METEIIQADPEDMSAAVAAAVSLLSAGEVVGLPTETVYGLGADALNPEAVAKIFAAKGRPSTDPLIVHVHSREAIFDVAEVSDELRPTVNALIAAHWPGPLTMVLPKKAHIPDIVTSGLDTVAVRMSDHDVMKNITKEFGRPIAAPSANKFGKISPTSALAVHEELGGEIPLILDAGACLEGVESTIVKVESGGGERAHLYLLRPGPVTKEDLQKIGKVIRPKKKPNTRDKDGNIIKEVRDSQVASVSQEAPGMLESHYSPATPMILLKKPEDFIPEEGKTYGLLSYRGQDKDGYMQLHDWQHIEELTPGKGKLAEAAVRLFYCMRELDKSGVDVIIAEPCSEVGLGVAIMDRLRRASNK